MAKRETLTRCEIRWDGLGAWCLLQFAEPGKRDRRWARHIDESRPNETKTAFIRRVVLALKLRIENGEYGFSLRICKKNGDYQARGERTFPRSADPRRSKG